MPADTVFEVTAQLGFSRPDEVEPQRDQRGLLRATTRPISTPFESQFALHSCALTDLCHAPARAPSLVREGFETIDLSRNSALQSLLSSVRRAGEISPDEAKQLRRQLTGAVFRLRNGRCLKMLNIAPEGLILRTGGPNGLQVDPARVMSEMNGHDVALAVHADQDVRGTPLKQIMKGRAPRFLRHQTPDGGNRLSPLMLTNLWIPLQQITRPLAFMDRQTLNATSHQLRYALPTDTFLERDEAQKNNDIWSFLHDPSQQWYFHSRMTHDRAYVFDTLGEPHGSFVLPGEARAEYFFLRLRALSAALQQGAQAPAPVGPPPALPHDTPLPLRYAVGEMERVAQRSPSPDAEERYIRAWRADAARVMDPVVRRSLEMRVVSLLLPDVWPLNRGS